MKALIANDFGRWRGLEVMRGWLVFFLILSLIASVSLAVWVVGGIVGFFAVLAFLVPVVFGFSRS